MTEKQLTKAQKAAAQKAAEEQAAKEQAERDKKEQAEKLEQEANRIFGQAVGAALAAAGVDVVAHYDMLNDVIAEAVQQAPRPNVDEVVIRLMSAIEAERVKVDKENKVLVERISDMINTNQSANDAGDIEPDIRRVNFKTADIDALHIRAGFTFSATPVEIDFNQLTDEQRERIESDPHLRIRSGL